MLPLHDNRKTLSIYYRKTSLLHEGLTLSLLTFSVGAVSWSSQQRGSDLEGETPYLERHAAQAKFYEFLRTFQTGTEGQQSSEVYKYR